MWRCSGWYLRAEASLRGVWRLALFSKAQDGVGVKATHASMSSPDFWPRLRVVRDIVVSTHDVREWGGGCACHEAERRQGEHVRCPMVGRRLPEASDRVDAFATGFTEALLEYALGRPCGFADDELVQQIVSRARDKDWQLREFFQALVASQEFQAK
jgi:hypothetical protein